MLVLIRLMRRGSLSLGRLWRLLRRPSTRPSVNAKLESGGQPTPMSGVFLTRRTIWVLSGARASGGGVLSSGGARAGKFAYGRMTCDLQPAVLRRAAVSALLKGARRR